MNEGKQISLRSLYRSTKHNTRIFIATYLVALLILIYRVYLRWPSDLSPMAKGLSFSPLFMSEITSAFFLSILLSFGLSLLVFGAIEFLADRTMKPRYVSGSKKISLGELSREVESSKEYDFRRSPSDIKVNLNDPNLSGTRAKVALRLPAQLGAGHSLFLGVSGAGKSQLMEAGFEKVRRCGNKAIIVDPGGRYFEKFGRKDDVILSLYDKRSELIDFWAEDASPEEIASSIIEERENGTGADEFYSLSPRAVFSGLMDASSSTEEMWQLLKSMDITKIRSLLQEVESMGANMLLARETAANVMTSLSVKMSWLKHINHWAKLQGKTEPFLLTKWARNDSDKRWVFLVSRERDWSFTKHIIRVWFDLVSNSVFGRNFDESKSKRIYAGCDEISTIGKLESLPKILDKGRKDGYHLWAGLQDVAQFYSAYGIQDGKNIINGFHNRFLFRGNGQELLSLMEESCGEGRWLKKVEQIDARGEKSLSVSETAIRPFVKDDFLNMPNLSFVVKLATMNPALARIEHISRPSINPSDMSEIPRPQKREKSSPEVAQKANKDDSKSKGKEVSKDEGESSDDEIPIWED